MRARLEKEGVISEYTIIPNFNKLGYHLFVLTFFTWKQNVSMSEMEEARKWAQEKVRSVPSNVVLIERGIGMGHFALIGSFHEDYSSYREFLDTIRQIQSVDVSRIESFIVDLDDKIHYRTLTFSTLAKHLLETNQKEK